MYEMAIHIPEILGNLINLSEMEPPENLKNTVDKAEKCINHLALIINNENFTGDINKYKLDKDTEEKKIEEKCLLDWRSAVTEKDLDEASRKIQKATLEMGVQLEKLYNEYIETLVKYATLYIQKIGPAENEKSE